MLSAVTHQLIRKPYATLLVLALLFGFLGVQAMELEIDPSFSSLISSDGEYNSNQRMLESAFPTNTGVFIIFSIDENSRVVDRPIDLRDTTLSEDVQELRELLAESQYVTQVGPLEYSDDGKRARIAVGAQEPNRPDGLVLVKDEMEYFVEQARVPIGVTASVTGLPILLDRVSTLLITDNLETLLITAVLVFLVLFWYFRKLKFALIGVTSAILSLVALAALMSWLDIRITLTLAAVGVMVVGLGADYSIHLITAYVRHLRQGHTPEESIEESMDELELPLIAAFLTTAAGFSALILGVSPSSQAQGIVLTLAITIIFLVTFLLLPVLLVAFAKEPPEKTGKQQMAAVGTFFEKLAHWQTKHPGTILAVVGLVTVVMLFGASMVSFSTSNSNWIPDDDPVSQSFRDLSYAFGDTESVSLVLTSTKGDLRELQTVRDTQELTARLSGIPGVEVLSPFDGVPLEKDAILKHVEQPQIRAQFNQDYTLTQITLSSEGFQVNEAGESLVLPEVRDTLDRTPVYGADVGLFGDVVRFDELGTSLQQDTMVTTLVGLVLVFIVASILYTSLAIGVVALFPIIIAVLWAVGLMGFFNIPFTSLSTGIVALVLGIGVDFSLHLVSSIRHQREQGEELNESIEHALQTSGGAILLSSITTFFGFLALTLATLLGTQRLGWSLAFSILTVFCVTILMVPAVISLRAKVLGKAS